MTPRQRRGQPEAGVIAERGEIGGETRFLAGHAEIGDEREPQPGADRAAVDRGDDGLAGLHQALRFVVQVLAFPTGPRDPRSAAASDWRRRRNACPPRRERRCGRRAPGRAPPAPIASASIRSTSRKLLGGRFSSTVATWPLMLTPTSLLPGAVLMCVFSGSFAGDGCAYPSYHETGPAWESRRFTASGIYEQGGKAPACTPDFRRNLASGIAKSSACAEVP